MNHGHDKIRVFLLEMLHELRLVFVLFLAVGVEAVEGHDDTIWFQCKQTTISRLLGYSILLRNDRNMDCLFYSVAKRINSCFGY